MTDAAIAAGQDWLLLVDERSIEMLMDLNTHRR